jgi:hypothetical protein
MQAPVASDEKRELVQLRQTAAPGALPACHSQSAQYLPASKTKQNKTNRKKEERKKETTGERKRWVSRSFPRRPSRQAFSFGFPFFFFFAPSENTYELHVQEIGGMMPTLVLLVQRNGGRHDAVTGARAV